MIKLQKIESADALKIVSWNENKGEEFLRQWAGNKVYRFPLTPKQIIDRSNEKSINLYTVVSKNEVVGTIELRRVEDVDDSMRLGRLLIDDKCRGKGYGGMAIKLVEEKAIAEHNASYIELGVYEFNIKAKALYERLGYKSVDLIEDKTDSSWNSHNMIKKL